MSQQAQEEREDNIELLETPTQGRGFLLSEALSDFMGMPPNKVQGELETSQAASKERKMSFEFAA